MQSIKTTPYLPRWGSARRFPVVKMTSGYMAVIFKEKSFSVLSEVQEESKSLINLPTKYCSCSMDIFGSINHEHGFIYHTLSSLFTRITYTDVVEMPCVQLHLYTYTDVVYLYRWPVYRCSWTYDIGILQSYTFQPTNSI